MKNKTIWDENIKTRSFNKKLDKETDILIIGGGITGLTTAYFFKYTNYNVMVLDLI